MSPREQLRNELIRRMLPDGLLAVVSDSMIVISDVVSERFVDIQLTPADLQLSAADFEKRIIAPAVAALHGEYASA